MSEADFSATHLLRQRRFTPLFLTQFFGAFNDNVFKNALIIFIIFHPNSQLQAHGAVLVTAAAGLFILPFLLFSAIAGQLADRLEKSSLIRRVKQAEIAIMALAGAGFWLDSVVFLMAVLFLMGTQSAMFGPLKYSILPQHLRAHELTTGNGLVQMATFVAILIGTMVGGFVMGMPEHGPAVISVAVVVFAILGFLTSRYIPNAPAFEPELRVRWNLVTETLRTMGYARENRTVFTCIIGISWFWFVGATYLQLFPAYTRDALHGDASVVTVMLSAFSVGIGVGALLCARLSRGGIETSLIPIGGAGLAIFSLLLPLAGPDTAGLAPAEGLTGAGDIWSVSSTRWVFADLVLVSVCGGLYIVPMNALVQSRSHPGRRARIIAASNVFNALLMVASALVTLALLSADVAAEDIIALVGAATLCVILVICARAPEFTARFRGAGVQQNTGPL